MRGEERGHRNRRKGREGVAQRGKLRKVERTQRGRERKKQHVEKERKGRRDA